MSLLSWNYRGLGNLRTVKALEKAVNKEEPNIVFLMETKSNREWMEQVKDHCKMKHGLIVPSDGSKGGLAMLWKEGIKVEVQTYSQEHIDVWVKGGWNGSHWHLTSFYGNPDTEVNFIGPKFTWLYQKANGTQIRERLDRALVTKEWIDLFPTAKLYHLLSSASNHSPLSLHLEKKRRQKKSKKIFRFELMWLKDGRCEDIVKAAWEEGLQTGTGGLLRSCLEQCRDNLDAWNKEEFGHVSKKIAELQRRLEWLELQPASPDMISDMRSTRADLNCWLDKEDEMWRQRSRLNWFQEGDRNTSFFHAKASARHQKNYIEGLVDEQGRWQEDEAKVGDIAVDYFEKLFTSNSPEEFTNILNAIQPKVSTTMNEELTRTFTAQELEWP
nr:uncharacterized protein LOC111982934 [Quercus suber]